MNTEKSNCRGKKIVVICVKEKKISASYLTVSGPVITVVK